MGLSCIGANEASFFVLQLLHYLGVDMVIAKQTMFSLLILILCVLPDVSIAGDKDNSSPEKTDKGKPRTPVRRDWGEIRWMPTGLELHVTNPPANGAISDSSNRKLYESFSRRACPARRASSPTKSCGHLEQSSMTISGVKRNNVR